MNAPAVYAHDLNISQEDLVRNIKNSLRYPQFRTGGSRGPVAVCAAGPSLLKEIPFLKAWHKAGLPICAVKGVADILVANGIIPNYAVFMDGKPDQVRFLKNPHPDIEYLIAGQCDPAVFDALEGFKVTVWHGEGRPLNILPKGTSYILGGSTSALRAISLMWAKGHDEERLVGFDCCVDGDRTHAYDNGSQKTIRTYYMGFKKFRASAQMAAQYNDFMALFGAERKINLIVHGDGMIAEAFRRLNDPARATQPIFISLDPPPFTATIMFDKADLDARLTTSDDFSALIFQPQVS